MVTHIGEDLFKEGYILETRMLLCSCARLDDAAAHEMHRERLANFLSRFLSHCYSDYHAFSSSPWSNEYDPPLEDGAVPSTRLRDLEIQANQAFDTYRELYYEGGVSSVYLWDLEHGFAGVVLIKKGLSL